MNAQLLPTRVVMSMGMRQRPWVDATPSDRQFAPALLMAAPADHTGAKNG